jgi:hypothetical protein
MMEYWNIGLKGENNHSEMDRIPNNPLFHHSIVPLEYSAWPIASL